MRHLMFPERPEACSRARRTRQAGTGHGGYRCGMTGPDATEARRLDLSDPDTLRGLRNLQRASYAVEAELIGFDGIPALHESLEELRDCGESFLGLDDETGLAGAVSWVRLQDGTLDICRLMVHPPRAPAGHRHRAARRPGPRRTGVAGRGINGNRQPSRPWPLQTAGIHTRRHAPDRARHQPYAPGATQHASGRSAHLEALTRRRSSDGFTDQPQYHPYRFGATWPGLRRLAQAIQMQRDPVQAEHGRAERHPVRTIFRYHAYCHGGRMGR